MMKTESTVFVVDDDAAVRDALGELLDTTGWCVEQHASAEDFLQSYNDDRPGCLVLDVRMPGMSGLDLLEQMAERGICLPTIILTGHGDVPMSARAFKAGAVDFLEKPFQEQVLLDCIRAAVLRDAKARKRRDRIRAVEHRIATLSEREHEVMDLVVAGKATKAIAKTLQISPKTVDFHRARIMSKMQATSLAELIRMAVMAEPDKAR